MQQMDSEITSHQRSKRSRLARLLCVDCLPCVPARYVLALVSCMGFVQVYALRVNLSVAIVQMVNNDSSQQQHAASAKVFNWSSEEQGWILSSFFFGYILTQIPGGWLAVRVGGRWVLGVGIVMTAVLTLFTPLAADRGIWAISLLRALEGFFEGVTFPAMHSIWAKWAPPLERSRLGTITYSGPIIGNVISFPLSAVLCQYAGWPVVFYVFGSISILWFFLWLWVGFSSPASHPRISEEERSYIESSIQDSKEKEVPIPWLQILTSPAVWAIIISHFCNNWGFYTLLTCIPSYLKDALPQLSINSAGVVLGGVYSAIPYSLVVLVIIVSGQVADFLRSRNILSTTAVRKIFNTGAVGGSAIGIVLCGYFGVSTLSSVSLVTVSVGCLGMAYAGFNINHLDIAPRFAGVLMGITNMVATLPGIIGPIVAKSIAHKPLGAPGSPQVYAAYREEWREVFIICAEIYIFGGVTYLLLASGNKQWWADGVKNRWSLTPEKLQYNEASVDDESEGLLDSERKGDVSGSKYYGIIPDGTSIGRSTPSVNDGNYDFSNSAFKEPLN